MCVRNVAGRYSHLISSFFFQCYVHHRDLHSFPTRCSSDLGNLRRVGARGGRFEKHGRAHRRDGRVIGRPRERSEEHTSDSSHANISYAVFCLKKKTSTTNRDNPPLHVPREDRCALPPIPPR